MKSSEGRQRGFISPGDVQALLIGLVVAGILVGLVIGYGVTWLWGIIRPWIHAVTA